MWVRHVRKSEHVTFLDVALLRWKEVRRSLAVQQFAQAKIERDAGNQQAAFLGFTFAVNNDPQNVEIRLAAAEFLRAAGSSNLAVDMLEAGLLRAPGSPQLIERTFDALSTLGRNQRTLDLLSRQPREGGDATTGARLRAYELQAWLNLGEAQRAWTLLQAHPELERHAAAVPVVARTLWENKERLRALELLRKYISGPDAPLAAYIQLVQLLLTAKMTPEALSTAEQACAKFPQEISARVLLIDALVARSFEGKEALVAIGKYLNEFGRDPQAMHQLGVLAARRGWVELARSIYEYGAVHQKESGLLAFLYSDALMQNARYREARDILSEVEAQAIEATQPFLVQLRHRQVIVAAALGDTTSVREHARRLAAALRNDPDGLEASRRHFQKIPIPDAVAELSGRASGLALNK